MQVGDLVKYRKPNENNGYGIILQNDDDGYVLLYWHDADPKYNDYVWEKEHWLEVISESR